MKDERIQYLTGSESLSLDEEYEMQMKWSLDEDKCTFIILDNQLLCDKNVNNLIGQTGLSNEIEAMIGDTNLYLNNIDNREEGEIEIMIAGMH